ncbi:hydrogenase maturation nickel metallochaperone HypA [Nitratifractor salsuginis]|uniref:Hydrogenase maturation factor HypA n=1 Tax=Nitratifractor salsuginis (strain DSM 16511 / JCM 12458 / E9I37-1) TaxID=749222 RepID=E6WYB5_NITSE|nr:hydrogenase maturation nickel metallochaperone HypA [Nitratifractor salsuginis]ADV45363.1 hydrogenase nickel insertion protein HypA [Nitratifractor salsuginis DSM 16511]
MHEYSIVQALLDQCEEHAAKHGAEKIVKVVTKIGVLSGVEPDLLQTAFDTFKEGTICEEAEFVMNIQPLVIYCRACQKESTLEELVMACPECGSLETNLLDGEDMYLMSLEME